MGFDSMFTGISGLNAYQSQIDMISNDIANVGTTGYKGQDMTFADMFYQNQGFASGPTQSLGGVNPQQIGLGVKVNSIDTNYAQGGLQTTGINTDLAINGDGFFVLDNTNGGQPVYTRDGHFSLNSNGMLYDPGSGMAVQGYMANAQGQVTAGGALGNITIPIGLSSQATGTGFGTKVGPSGDSVFDVQMGGNLDQTQWQQEEQGIINGNGPGQGQTNTISTTIYDSLGNAHQAYIKYVPDATGATPAGVASAGAANTSGAVTVGVGTPNNDTITITANAAGTQATVTDTNGYNQTYNAGQQVTVGGATFTLATPLPSNGVETVTVTGATTGLPATVNNTQGTAVAPATRWKEEVYLSDGTMINGQAATSTNPATVGYAYYDQNGQFINTSSGLGVPGAALTTNLHQAGAAASTVAGDALNVTGWGLVNGNQPTPATIGLDFSNTTSLASASGTNGSGYTDTVVSQNGYPAGTLSNITIGQDGTVTGAFTNGQNKTLAQVALATFQNEDGLQRIGSNGFQATANSGLAQMGSGGSGRFGAIVSGSLEESNVSLADEFTKMIVAQRAFEANTRGIDTADQNMQDILAIRGSEN